MKAQQLKKTTTMWYCDFAKQGSNCVTQDADETKIQIFILHELSMWNVHSMLHLE